MNQKVKLIKYKKIIKEINYLNLQNYKKVMIQIFNLIVQNSKIKMINQIFKKLFVIIKYFRKRYRYIRHNKNNKFKLKS